jgi:ABC-type lipoprotein release transport system permease subunit
VSPADPFAFGATALLVMLVAVLAAALPALRAARTPGSGALQLE